MNCYAEGIPAQAHCMTMGPSETHPHKKKSRLALRLSGKHLLKRQSRTTKVNVGAVCESYLVKMHFITTKANVGAVWKFFGQNVCHRLVLRAGTNFYMTSGLYNKKNAIKNKQNKNKQTFKHALITHLFSWHHWIVNCSVRFATHVAAWVYDKSNCNAKPPPSPTAHLTIFVSFLITDAYSLLRC